MKNIIKLLFSKNTSNYDSKDNLNTKELILSIKKELKSKNSKIVVKTDSYLKNHLNLLAYLPSKKPYILFQGHIDTFPDETNFRYQIKSDKLIGRGAVDMKGSIVGMIDAFLKTVNNDGEYEPMLLLTSDEEANDFAGIKHFLKKKPDNIMFAINGEPTNSCVATRMKGLILMDFTFLNSVGHTASASKPTLIEEQISNLVYLKRYLDEVRMIKNNSFGNTIAALTVISGGEVKNQLPQSLKFHLHIRSSEVSDEYSVKNIKKIFKKHVNMQIFEPQKAVMPSFYTKFSDLKEIVFDGFSEANIMNAAGIPTLVYGVGDLKLAHSMPEKEVVCISEIKKYSNSLQDIFE